MPLPRFLSPSVLLIFWTLDQLVYFLLGLTFLLTLILLGCYLRVGNNLTIFHGFAFDIVVGDDDEQSEDNKVYFVVEEEDEFIDEVELIPVLFLYDM